MNTDDGRSIVARKRDGAELSSDEMRTMVGGYMRGDVSDALLAALLMACAIRGMSLEETVALTRAMVESGTTLRFEAVAAPLVDKHSTGGVADGVTLLFAPIAAAVGLGVAKLAGRGLGHTGGTIDKLESIPGLHTDLTPSEIERQVRDVGCAVAAQSADLVPADGAIYALRDATATVPSQPLIAASVMSKKLAVQSDLILLDVKAGSGAFMQTAEAATGLARLCVEIANLSDRRSGAAVTDMSQPLGRCIGNALEVAEAVGVMRGETRGRLRDLALWFVARAAATLLGTTIEEARESAERSLDSGSALERFGRMVEAQGGDARLVDLPRKVLPRAPEVRPLVADRSGHLAAVDAAELGRACMELGAGRSKGSDRVDPSVGIVMRPEVGERIEAGSSIGEIHARNEEEAARAATRALRALDVVEEPVTPPPLVLEWLGEGGSR